METGRNVMHYALGDNQDYEHEWSKAVLAILQRISVFQILKNSFAPFVFVILIVA